MGSERTTDQLLACNSNCHVQSLPRIDEAVLRHLWRAKGSCYAKKEVCICEKSKEGSSSSIIASTSRSLITRISPSAHPRCVIDWKPSSHQGPSRRLQCRQISFRLRGKGKRNHWEPCRLLCPASLFHQVHVHQERPEYQNLRWIC